MHFDLVDLALRNRRAAGGGSGSFATRDEQAEVQPRPLCPEKRPTTVLGPHVAMGHNRTSLPQSRRPEDSEQFRSAPRTRRSVCGRLYL
jgi:hypothetical protein